MSTPVTDATHPTDRDLVRYLDDEATATERERARDHLRECSRCHRRFEILTARSAALSAMIEDLEVPERETTPPRALTRGRSVSRRTRSSARTSPWEEVAREDGPMTPAALKRFARTLIKRKRGITYADAAKLAELHPNGLSMALNAPQSERIGTVIRTLRAMGCEVEVCYKVRWREPEKRASIHLN